MEHSKYSAQQPSIIDLGCGFGGLMFSLERHFPQNRIIGLEIREKVAEYVAKKITYQRQNSN